MLPYYADEYGATPLVVGLLTASYAAAQLIGAPLLGRLSDRYGRRPVLLVSIFGTMAGFLLLGLAEPLGTVLAHTISGTTSSIMLTNVIIIAILFMSRIIDGLTGGNISVAQAYITDITDEQNRARGLGLIGAAFGLGFILGPALGGILSNWGYAAPAFLAAGLATINLIAVYLYLPESLTLEQRASLASRERPRFSLGALWNALNRPGVGPLLHVRFFFGLAFATFQTIFPLFALYRLDLNAQETGFVLAYVGILVALVQGVGIGKLTSRFREVNLIFASAIIMTISLLAWAFTPNLIVLLIVLIPLSFAGGTLNTVLNSTLTKSVASEEVGGTLGLSASLESLTRVIAPSMGGFLLGALGTWAPGVASVILMIWATSFTKRRILGNPDIAPRAKQDEPANISTKDLTPKKVKNHELPQP